MQAEASLQSETVEVADLTTGSCGQSLHFEDEEV
jgi:hypothetical protein